ncbi:hypothetical protein [Thiocapsa marina]|nr:hypothetical protein [Thiocapsa marina]
MALIDQHTKGVDMVLNATDAACYRAKRQRAGDPHTYDGNGPASAALLQG